MLSDVALTKELNSYAKQISCQVKDVLSQVYDSWIGAACPLGSY